MAGYHAASGSAAEDLFIELFSDTFGAEKAGYLYSQYPFFDIYQNSRFADFVLENGARRIAIEIDDEASHNKSIIAENKFYDHLLKQNSMVHLGWDIYRFAVRQMQQLSAPVIKCRKVANKKCRFLAARDDIWYTLLASLFGGR